MQQQYRCPRCGAPVAFGVRFCTNCGTQLNWPTQQQAQPPPQYQQPQQPGQWGGYQQQSGGWGKKIMVGLIIAVIFALVVCLAPLREVAYTVMVDYQDTETYLAVENYLETVPLSYKVVDSHVRDDVLKQRSRIVIGGVVFQDEVVEIPIKVACVSVRNTDTVRGTFTVSFSVAKPLDTTLCTKTLNLDPSEEGLAECPAYDLGNWNYSVNPGAKVVENERQVEKQRTATKQRPETRYKKVTLLDYLLHY